MTSGVRGAPPRPYDRNDSPDGAIVELDLTDVPRWVATWRTASGAHRVPHPPDDAEVTGRRNTSIYAAHSYPTKQPPETIRPFIEHFTRPGDVVLDPFAGSGMTGVAACLAGRRAILNDLSPLAIHLSYNHTTPCDPDRLVAEFAALYQRLRPEFECLYGAWGDSTSERPDGYVHYTLWSVVYACPFCRNEICFWDAAVDQTSGRVADAFACPTCARMVSKLGLSIVRSDPVQVSVETDRGQRTRRPPNAPERVRISALAREPIADWFPDAPFAAEREMFIRCALQLQGIARTADFYTPRNLRALAHLWREIREVTDRRIRRALQFAFTNTAWHGTRMRRFNARGGQRPLTGTLYIPQISSEVNVLEVMRHKVRQLRAFYASYQPPDPFVPPALRVGSATNLAEIPDGAVDYAFFDPPFGSNLFYSDLNFLLEGWIGAVTRPDDEIVVNRSLRPSHGGKTVDDYRRLLGDALGEVHRVLKTGAWASVVFRNTDSRVWEAFLDAADAARLDVGGTSGIHRLHLSMKGYRGWNDAEDVAHNDVVLHLRRRDRWTGIMRRAGVDESSLLVLLSDHLRAVDGNRALRTTQYLHALALRTLVADRVSVDGVTLDYVRRLCARSFELREGAWYFRTVSTIDQRQDEVESQ